MENRSTENILGDELVRNFFAGASVVAALSERVCKEMFRIADRKVAKHYGRPLRIASAS